MCQWGSLFIYFKIINVRNVKINFNIFNNPKFSFGWVNELNR